MILGKGTTVDLGGLLNKGFELLQSKLGGKTSGPVAAMEQPNDWTPVESNKMPAWVLPVAIVAAALLLLKKKKRRR